MLAPVATSLVQPVISSVVKVINGRGVRRTGRGYMDKKMLVLLYPLNNIKIPNYFNYKPRLNGIFLRNNLLRMKDRVYVINVDDENSKVTH